MDDIIQFNNCSTVEELYALFYGNVMDVSDKEFLRTIEKFKTIKNVLDVDKVLTKINKNIVYDNLKVNTIDLNNVNTIYDVHHDAYSSVNNKISGDFNVSKTTIICFSMISYNYRIQRNQHICKLMANRGYNVIYINTTFEHSLNVCEICDNLYQVSLNCGDNSANVYTTKLNQNHISNLLVSIEKLKKKFNFDFFVSYVANPFWYQLLRFINNTHIIYDCMDYHEGFGNISKHVIDNEKQLLKNCDTLMVSSPILVNKLNIRNKKYSLVRNGCDYSYFSSIKKNTTKKIIGYYGAVSDWFDSDLVRKIALKYYDYSIYIIGNVSCNNKENTEKINKLRNVDNIVFFGEIPYNELYEYVCNIDIGIIPFIINPLIECTNPVKLYEMLSIGIPVVMTNLTDVHTLGRNDLYYLSSNHDDFLNNIQNAIQESSEIRFHRQQYAMQNTWDIRVDIFESIIRKVNPFISVVLLCYNNWLLTEKCIESLVKNTNYNNYEIVVVNNDSTDGTKEKLLNYKNLKIVNNESNYGFALGMNIGALHSNGEYVVLLNNDTYCMKDWLYPLLKPYFKYDNCGIVSPITNNCGNEIKQFVKFSDMVDLQKKIKKLQYNRKYEIKQQERVPFFSPIVKKKDFYRCGLLDSNFGRGGWEDDDIIHRYNIMNKNNYYTYGSFVYHQESATISEGYTSTSNNKLYFEKKWNTIWHSPSYKYTKIDIFININNKDLIGLIQQLEQFIQINIIVDQPNENTIIFDTFSDRTHIHTIIHPDYYIFDEYKYSKNKWDLLGLYSIIFTKKYCC